MERQKLGACILRNMKNLNFSKALMNKRVKLSKAGKNR